MWGEIRNEFIEEKDNKLVMNIDAWETADDNEEGIVIATIEIDITSPDGIVTVNYLHDKARTNEYAREIIVEGIGDLRNYFNELKGDNN